MTELPILGLGQPSDLAARYIMARHPYAFRSGQWAQIVCVDEGIHGRPCFLVVFEDGATDMWPCQDDDADYIFSRNG